MTNRITPPPELVHQLRHSPGTWLDQITIAYQAGADMELEACCESLYNRFASPGHQAQAVAQEMRDWLRATRRSKPPSLKEQALEAFNRLSALALQEYEGCEIHKEYAEMADQVRHGLKQLPD